jgi:hypothetical protein
MKAGAVSDHYGGSAGLRCCCLGVANLGSWSKMVAIGQRTATLSNVRFRELRQPLGGWAHPGHHGSGLAWPKPERPLLRSQADGALSRETAVATCYLAA